MTKTRQSTLAITATILLKIIMAENSGNSGSIAKVDCRVFVISTL